MRLTSHGGPRCLLLIAALAACSGEASEDELAIEATDDAGLRATTSIDDEAIVIESRIVRAQATTPEGESYEDEALLASIVGEAGTVYAELRHTTLSDDLSGTIAGLDVAGEGSSALRAGSWDQVVGTHPGRVLVEVSSRAAAVLDSGDLPELEEPLQLVADVGPYLAGLADEDDFGICGDGACSVAEDDVNCPADCGCAAATSCGGVAAFGCYCDAECGERGDCCVDSCETCGVGCPPCEEEQVACTDGCDLASNVCDGVADCPAGQDEAQCSPSCHPGEMACRDGTCIAIGRWCDGADDCSGGDDEICACTFCQAG
jgi:hypothetical protein